MQFYHGVLPVHFVVWLSLAAGIVDRSHGEDKILLVAGGQKNAVDIPAMDALLREPFGTAFDAANQLWIVEMASGNRLLKVDQAGEKVQKGQKTRCEVIVQDLAGN